MILVLVEHGRDGIADTSLETLRFAADLGAEGGGIPVDAFVVAGEGGAPDAAELGRHGVRRVYVVTGHEAYSAAAWAAALQEVRATAKSVVVTAAGTPRGNEVLAHVACREEVPMAANVIAFSGLSPFVVTRQAMGGAVQEQMRLHHRPAVFSVAGHAVEARPGDGGPAEVVEVAHTPVEADLVARVVSTTPGESGGGGGLAAARVVVGAGRGAGGPEGFGPAIELADLLGGRLGVSRVVTSLGWRPHHEQVGQTGTRIAPDLYVPCGISGAIQHWAGCASSKVILAINTDADAPMMTRATYAVTGDMHEVVPAINEEIRGRKG